MDNQSLQQFGQQITPEMREKSLKRARAEVANRQVMSLPTLKLKNTGSDAVEGVKDGEFYVTFMEEDKDGNKKLKAIPVGANPEIVIISRLYSYSWYNEKADGGDGRLMAWTNEIESFGDLKIDGTVQDVVLVENPEGAEEPKIVYHGNYKGFKAYKDANYKDRNGDNLLKFRNVLYVYLQVPGTEKCVFRMFVSNASVTGVKDGEKTGDYKNPEPLSLMKFIESVQSSECGVLFGTKAKLGSRYKTGGIPYYLIQFENAGPVEVLDAMNDLYIQLHMYLDARFESDFGNLESMESGPVRTDVIDAKSEGRDIAFESLPDVK